MGYGEEEKRLYHKKNSKGAAAPCPWASAAGGRGRGSPLDFHTWYKYSK